MSAPDPDPIRLDAGRLALVWAWSGDRYHHAIAWEDRPVVHSIEVDRPGLPAYQQLHVMEQQADRYALPVGQAGSDHFAASFLLGADFGQLAVDVAARGPDASLPIACLYLVDAAWSLVDAGPEGATWEDVARKIRLRLVGESATIALQPASRRGECRVLILGRDPGPPARRCVYRWSFRTPEDPRT